METVPASVSTRGTLRLPFEVTGVGCALTTNLNLKAARTAATRALTSTTKLRILSSSLQLPSLE